MGKSMKDDQDTHKDVKDDSQDASFSESKPENTEATETTDSPVATTSESKTDKPVEETTEEKATQPESTGSASSATTPPPPPAKPKSKGPIILAIVAIIIALAALGGAGYLYQQFTLLQAESENLASANSNLKSNLSSTSNKTQSLASQSQSQASTISTLQSDLKAQQSNVDELQGRLTESMKQISKLGTNTRKDWLLAEAEYLLRLANQRVLLERSANGALALLQSADDILRETNDVSLYNVRKALATDVAALEAIPSLDVDGIFLKLAALNERVDHLTLLPVSETPELPDMLSEVDEATLVESWKDGFMKSWDTAIDKLGNLIIIQHRDEAIEPLLTHDQAYFIQQNLHLMIEQAQLSLLQGHQQSFDASLNKATDWIARYFREDDSSTQALLKGLNELKSTQVAPQLPDISGSLRTLKQYFADVHSREQQGEG